MSRRKDRDHFEDLAREHAAHLDKEVRGGGMGAEERRARIESWFRLRRVEKDEGR
ncbi:MAG: hypothetical protein WAT47_13915 [Nostocoides sp.]